MSEKAFSQLKHTFNTTPFLKHPHLLKPFMVEVGTFETGVGATLSHHAGKRLMLHPVTFYSKKLTPAERNYDIRDHDL